MNGADPGSGWNSLQHISKHGVLSLPPVLQITASLNAIRGRCGWVWETLNGTQKANMAKCYNYAVQQYVAYEVFDDHLFNNVYPVLVRTSMLASLYLSIALYCNLAFLLVASGNKDALTD